MSNCPIFYDGVKLSAVSYCPSVKLSSFVLMVSNCPILHDGVKLSALSNCWRCQIVLLTFLVSNCPSCHIVPSPIILEVFDLVNCMNGVLLKQCGERSLYLCICVFSIS